MKTVLNICKSTSNAIWQVYYQNLIWKRKHVTWRDQPIHDSLEKKHSGILLQYVEGVTVVSMSMYVCMYVCVRAYVNHDFFPRDKWWPKSI